MRGIKDFNFPAFDKAAEFGRSLGHIVISPADMDREAGFEFEGKTCPRDSVPENFDLEACVRRDCEAVIQCDAIALLPGWKQSKGASAEYALALWLKRHILDATTFATFGYSGQINYGTVHRDDKHYQIEVETAAALNPTVRRGDIQNGEFVIKDSGERTVFATGAQRDMQAGKGYFHLMPSIAVERLAKLYEAGAVKYGPNNWQKGMPLFVFINSAFRHLFKLKDGMIDEDHAAAALWNVAGYIWTENEIKEGRMSKGLLELTNELVEAYLKQNGSN